MRYETVYLPILLTIITAMQWYIIYEQTTDISIIIFHFHLVCLLVYAYVKKVSSLLSQQIFYILQVNK